MKYLAIPLTCLACAIPCIAKCNLVDFKCSWVALGFIGIVAVVWMDRGKR